MLKIYILDKSCEISHLRVQHIPGANELRKLQNFHTAYPTTFLLFFQDAYLALEWLQDWKLPQCQKTIPEGYG